MITVTKCDQCSGNGVEVLKGYNDANDHVLTIAKKEDGTIYGFTFKWLEIEKMLIEEFKFLNRDSKDILDIFQKSPEVKISMDLNEVILWLEQKLEDEVEIV